MPRLFGRLWRSGGRRAETAEEAARVVEDPEVREEIGQRIEAARERLRQSIPPPEDGEDPQT